ncbi:MAG: DUF951 domain-containing protein [Leptolinea sp.]|nr:DUF951 domain-containing protein [Leptolinea sp.]
MFSVLPEIALEDIVRLRKPHPCGSYEWKVVRLGADIGLECNTCHRKIILPRRELARRLKKHIPKESNANTTT